MIIYGVNAVREALLATDSRVARLFISRDSSNTRLHHLVHLARKSGIPVSLEPAERLAQKAATTHHQQVVAKISAIPYRSLDSILAEDPRLLLLTDCVEDPRNLGALLRTGEAAGVEGVLLPRRNNCGVTPSVVRSSAGAALHLKICRISNVVRSLEKLKKIGFWIVGLDLQGQHRFEQVDVREPLTLIVGGEHKGLRPLVKRHCDFRVSLPMKGKVLSLNLSVAAAIFLYRVAQEREKENQ